MLIEKHVKNKIYNYFIVGSGPGGSATAYELSKTETDIILVEKGSYKNPNHKN